MIADSYAELRDFTDGMMARLAAITFDRDDAASIRAALAAVRNVLVEAHWSGRAVPGAAQVCRQLWDDLADTLLAYRYRAGLSAVECELYRVHGFQPATYA